MISPLLIKPPFSGGAVFLRAIGTQKQPVHWERASLLFLKRRTPAGLAFLSSGFSFRQNQIRSEVDDGQHRQKRKTARAPAAKTSLRKVAIEAQRSRDLSVEKPAAQDGHVATKVVHPLRSGVSGIQLTRIFGLLDSHSILCC